VSASALPTPREPPAALTVDFCGLCGWVGMSGQSRVASVDCPNCGAGAHAVAYVRRRGAGLARHASDQAIETPPDFLSAVVKRFGPLAFDLAADRSNAKALRYYGVGGEQSNALATESPWGSVVGMPRGNRWLNPPFGHMLPWVEKAARTVREGQFSPGDRVLLLAPAAVGANWYLDWAMPFARTVLLRGRVQFVGQEHPYPKDLTLLLYGDAPGTEVWDWRSDVTVPAQRRGA
jgi:hypothetical protein